MAFQNITILMKRNLKSKKERKCNWNSWDLVSIFNFRKFSSTFIQQCNNTQDAIAAAYKTLGLKNNANLNEVKATYYQLALKWYVFFSVV